LLGIRTHRWKLVRCVGDVEGELYDLQADPGEFRNLWDDPDYLDTRRVLAEMLLDRLYEASPPWPVRHFGW
jgi:arylsulfatase A-like enzyme